VDAATHGVKTHKGKGQGARGGGSLKGGAQVDEAVYGHALGTRKLEDTRG
jgi:hypothetical protein